MPDVTITVKTVDQSSATTAKIKENFQTLAPGIEKAGKAVTGFVSANATLIGGLVATGVVLKKAYDTTMQYGKEVRDLSIITGTGAEKTSRLLQVLDDYEISAQDAEVATKALTRNGYIPTVETLANLSDQYLALTDVQSRNEFVIKNLGKAGLQWVNMLSQGSAAILEQNAAVDKNLILSDRQAAAIEKQRLRVDQFKDSIDGMKVSAVAGFLEWYDASDTAAAASNKLWETGQKLVDQYWKGAKTNAMYSEEVRRVGAEWLRAEQYGKAWEVALSKQQQTVQGSTVDYAAMLKEGLALTKMEKEYGDALSKTVTQTKDINYLKEQYKAQQKEIIKAEKDGIITKKEEQKQLYELQKAWADGTFQAKEQQKAIADLGKQQTEQMSSYLSALLEQKGATDEQMAKFALASKQISKGALDQQKAFSKIADAFMANKISAEQAYRAEMMMINGVAAANGMSAEMFIDVFITTHGSMPTDVIGDSNMFAPRTHGGDVDLSGGTITTGGAGYNGGKAAGGTNLAQGMYDVGERGMEGLYVGKDGNVAVIPNDVWKKVRPFVTTSGGFAMGLDDGGGAYSPTVSRSYSRGGSAFLRSALLSPSAASSQITAQLSNMQQQLQQVTQTVSNQMTAQNRTPARVTLTPKDYSMFAAALVQAGIGQ